MYSYIHIYIYIYTHTYIIYIYVYICMYSIVCITCYTCMIDIHASQRKSRGTGDGGLSRVMLQCYVMICVCYSGFPSGIIR